MDQNSEAVTKPESTDLFDRIFAAVDKFISHYLEHPQEIVVPFLKLTIALNIFWMAYMIPSWISLYESTTLITEIPGAVVPVRSLWIAAFYSLAHPMIILIAVGSIKRVRSSPARAVSAIAAILVLQLISIQIFQFLIGLYALFNEAFRKQVVAEAPQWYRRIVQ